MHNAAFMVMGRFGDRTGVGGNSTVFVGNYGIKWLLGNTKALRKAMRIYNLCLFSPLASFLNSAWGIPATNLSRPPKTSATP